MTYNSLLPTRRSGTTHMILSITFHFFIKQYSSYYITGKKYIISTTVIFSKGNIINLTTYALNSSCSVQQTKNLASHTFFERQSHHNLFSLKILLESLPIFLLMQIFPISSRNGARLFWGPDMVAIISSFAVKALEGWIDREALAFGSLCLIVRL